MLSRFGFSRSCCLSSSSSMMLSRRTTTQNKIKNSFLLFEAKRFCSSTSSTTTTTITPTNEKVDLLEDRLDSMEKVLGNLVANMEVQQQQFASLIQQQQQQHENIIRTEIGTNLPQQTEIQQQDTSQQQQDHHHNNAQTISEESLTSVVKVYSSMITPNALSPWQTKSLTNSTGSAFVVDVERRLLLTNSHVVSFASLIEVRQHGQAKRHVAETVFISGDCDLALIRVSDDAFWENNNTKALAFYSNPSTPTTVTSSSSSNNDNDEKISSKSQKQQKSKISKKVGIDEIASITTFDFPELQSQVVVLGCPLGGDQISATAGVISRIDSVGYSSSGLRAAVIQIDAAINPGCSGGCALSLGSNTVVGVSFQSLIKGENIGYLIPNSITAEFCRAYLRFLKKNNNNNKKTEENSNNSSTNVCGYHEGFNSIGIYFQDCLSNPTVRDHFKVPDFDGGFLLEKLIGRSSNPNSSVLKPHDIIVQVDDYKIERDVTVEFRPSQRLSFTHLIHTASPDTKLNFHLWREGKKIELDVSLSTSTPLVRPHLLHPRFKKKPDCLLFCGFVFTTLNMHYLESWGNSWVNDAPRSLTNEWLYSEYVAGEREEIVVVCQMLPHSVNRGYEQGSFVHRAVDTVNGKKIVNFQHFRQEMKDLLSAENNSEKNENNNNNPTVEIKLKDGSYPVTLILPLNQAQKCDDEICNIHAIPTVHAVALNK